MVVFYDQSRFRYESIDIEVVAPAGCSPGIAPGAEACCGSCKDRSEAENPADPMLCHCLQVTRSSVVKAVHEHGARSLCEIANLTGAGGGCTACHRRIRAVLNQARVHPTVEAAERPTAEVPTATSALLLPHPSATADSWPSRPR
jgi:bacterioferritin-associated ferredoxin